jgi:hypothetical protein
MTTATDGRMTLSLPVEEPAAVRIMLQSILWHELVDRGESFHQGRSVSPLYWMDFETGRTLAADAFVFASRAGELARGLAAVLDLDVDSVTVPLTHDELHHSVKEFIQDAHEGLDEVPVAELHRAVDIIAGARTFLAEQFEGGDA